MAKSLKRVGIVFFAFVLSLLLVLGTMYATSAAENNSNSIVNTNSQNNEIAENNVSTDYSAGNIQLPSNSKVYEAPKADIEIKLGGSFNEMSTKWSDIYSLAQKSNQTIKVVLQNDWIAEDHETLDTYFGPGGGFYNGSIYYASKAQLIFDLNGNMLDRRLDGKQRVNGSVITNDGNLIVTDSNYDAERAITIYNECKAENNDFANLKSRLREEKFGIITGGASEISAYGGGIRSLGKLAMYGGIIMDNVAHHGAGVFSANGFDFYEGMIMLNSAGNGGGIYSYNSDFNLHNGIFLNNKAEYRGGGIYTSGGALNMLGGSVCENLANMHGSGICLTGGTIFNMYGGKISYNRMNKDIAHKKDEYGIGLYADTSIFNMYDGEISYNYDGRCGGGFALDYSSVGTIYDGKIINNEVIVNSAGILVYRESKLTMYGGEVSGNIIDRTGVPNRIDAGAGIGMQNYAVLEMYGGLIKNNKIINDTTGVAGGGIYIMTNCFAYLNGGVVHNNTVESTDIAKGGGIYFERTGNLTVGGGLQAYGNKVKGKGDSAFIDSDLHIDNNVKLRVGDTLTKNGIAKIGVYFANEDSDTAENKEFTTGFALYNSFSPKLVFFSNKANELVKNVVTENGFTEAAMSTGTKPTSCVTWSWAGTESGSINNNNVAQAIVTYSGEPFVVKMEDKNFYQTGNGTAAKSFTVKEAGVYSFYTAENYLNLNFTIIIEPKEVDVLWQNTDMIYNGSFQKPVAYIAEDANCKVTTIGEKVHSGNGYVVSAIELSNKNYKINSSTMYTTFSISKAKLNKPSGEINFEYDGSQKEFLPIGFDSKTMNITGNTATNVGSYTATISLKDKANYEWVDKTNNDVTIKYAITLTPQVEEGEYKFIYIDDEGYRKTYKQGGIVHGVNDSSLNGGRLVLGNIAPNTSVKRFVETLGYDTSKIVIKDSAEKEIYVNGVPVDQSTYDKRFELAVGTGWRVEYTTTGGTEIIYLSVLGDINGDGRISASDCAYLREIANDKALYDNLNAEIKLASLIINKGKVTSADSEIILNVINQKLTMDLFF